MSVNETVVDINCPRSHVIAALVFYGLLSIVWVVGGLYFICVNMVYLYSDDEICELIISGLLMLFILPYGPFYLSINNSWPWVCFAAANGSMMTYYPIRLILLIILALETGFVVVMLNILHPCCCFCFRNKHVARINAYAL